MKVFLLNENSGQQNCNLFHWLVSLSRLFDPLSVACALNLHCGKNSLAHFQHLDPLSEGINSLQRQRNKIKSTSKISQIISAKVQLHFDLGLHAIKPGLGFVFPGNSCCPNHLENSATLNSLWFSSVKD